MRTLYGMGILLSKSARVFSRTGANRSSSSSVNDEMRRMSTKLLNGLKAADGSSACRTRSASRVPQCVYPRIESCRCGSGTTPTEKATYWPRLQTKVGLIQIFAAFTVPRTRASHRFCPRRLRQMRRRSCSIGRSQPINAVSPGERFQGLKKMKTWSTLGASVLLCASVVSGTGPLMVSSHAVGWLPSANALRRLPSIEPLSEPAGLLLLGLGSVVLARRVRRKGS